MDTERMMRRMPDFVLADLHEYYDQFASHLDGKIQTIRGEQQCSLPSHMGQGTVKRMRIRAGMEILVSDLTFHQDMRFKIRGAYPIFELNYCISGGIRCHWDGKETHTERQSGNICFLENAEVVMEKEGGSRLQSVEIRMCPTELLRYTEDSTERQKMELLLSRHRGNMERYSNTPLIQKSAYDLVQCPYKGAMKRLYMESKAMELISFIFQEEWEESAGSKLVLRNDDIEKLNQVKEWVSGGLERPLSIRELAKKARMNEYKLKNGFRELFGMAIFEYVRKKRMEEALRLMEQERMNVGETASALGYSNAHSIASV